MRHTCVLIKYLNTPTGADPLKSIVYLNSRETSDYTAVTCLRHEPQLADYGTAAEEVRFITVFIGLGVSNVRPVCVC